MNETFGTFSLSSARVSLLKAAQAQPCNWMGRRLALILRKLALIKGPHVIDAEVEGLKLRVRVRDNVSERKFLFMPQFFDAAERDYIRRHLPEGGVFFDVGANVGIYTLTAAQTAGARGRVIAVEPNPRAMERLAENARLNGFEDRVFMKQCGLSDKNGSFTLTLDPTNLGGSSLIHDRAGEKVEVSCLTFAALVRETGVTRIDGLKIDIEGAEDRVLVPFLNEVPQELHPRFIIVENSDSDWKQDLNAELEKSGYRRALRARMNSIWVKDISAG